MKKQNKPYIIAIGTRIVEMFDTYDDMIDYFVKMEQFDAITCTLYDQNKRRYIIGQRLRKNLDNPNGWLFWK